MKTFTKKYQVWQLVGEGYSFEEYDTLAECIAVEKHGAWYITKGVTLAVTEASEPIPAAGFGVQTTTGKDLLNLMRVDETITEEDKESAEYARKMARGPIGKIG